MRDMKRTRVGRWVVSDHDDGSVTIVLDEEATPPGVVLEIEVHTHRDRTTVFWLLGNGQTLRMERGARA
jgi:hypothetical protein